jgi:putative transcriptional regulator
VTKCDECGAQVTPERNAVRRYDMGGLPHVELHGVEVIRCEKCGNEEVAIPRIGELHRAIAASMVKQRRMVAPVEIRFLRKHIRLSGNDFAQRMGVSRETVSRWETGANPMGAVADRLLRLLVLTHEPSDNYVVDDLLKQLNDRAPPDKLPSVGLWNGGARGWTEGERPPPALAG